MDILLSSCAASSSPAGRHEDLPAGESPSTSRPDAENPAAALGIVCLGMNNRRSWALLCRSAAANWEGASLPMPPSLTQSCWSASLQLNTLATRPGWSPNPRSPALYPISLIFTPAITALDRVVLAEIRAGTSVALTIAPTQFFRPQSSRPWHSVNAIVEAFPSMQHHMANPGNASRRRSQFLPCSAENYVAAVA
jgi:hypothetical protein